jgi:hypothetical protein
MTNNKIEKVENTKTPCGGDLVLTTSKEHSTVSGKFVGIKIGTECESCAYKMFCLLQFNPTSRVKKTPTAKPPVPAPAEPVERVMVYAFTGMPIGELAILDDLKDVIEVETKGGQKLVFDKTTGIQTNCKNPKYANRIIR